jgi:hypothetical protein
MAILLIAGGTHAKVILPGQKLTIGKGKEIYISTAEAFVQRSRSRPPRPDRHYPTGTTIPIQFGMSIIAFDIAHVNDGRPLVKPE